MTFFIVLSRNASLSSAMLAYRDKAKATEAAASINGFEVSEVELSDTMATLAVIYVLVCICAHGVHPQSAHFTSASAHQSKALLDRAPAPGATLVVREVRVVDKS